MQERSTKHGHHYRRLAAVAHAANFGAVTPWAIQSWVKHGLLPRVRYEHVDFGVRVAAGTDEIEEQLLALCQRRYHYRIRSHVDLALALWMDGWDVEETVVRDSFRRYVAPVADLADETRRGDAALRVAELPSQWSRIGRGEIATRALALDTLFGLISGARTGSGSDLSQLALLEQASGLDRARTDRLGGKGPWLPTAPGVGLRQGAEGLAAPRVLAALEAATTAELEAARTRAAALHEYFAVAIPMVAIGFGPDFAGLGALRDAVDDPRLRSMLVLVALVVPEHAARMVEALPSQAELAEWRAAVETARRMLAADDQLASRAAVIGLVAALEEDAPTGTTTSLG